MEHGTWTDAVLTEWESLPHLRAWLANKDYAALLKEMDGLLGKPVSYQMLQRQKDDVFLL